MMRDLINIVENVTVNTAYHITLARNIQHVMADGLIPRVGPRSRKLKEPRPAIYLFPTLEDAETAYSHWLSDEFSETTRLALLKVSIPHTIEVHTDAPFECHVYDPIPAVCLSVQTMDLGNEPGFEHLG
jgi:hypothetical protein